MRKNSYSPYSGFRVGASLLTSGGSIYTGTNVENSSYPVGLCAERAAFAAAVAAGERGFEAICIIGASGDIPDDYCQPCGMCRQFMAELCPEGFEVILACSEDKYRIFTLGELLPLGFRLER